SLHEFSGTLVPHSLASRLRGRLVISVGRSSGPDCDVAIYTRQATAAVYGRYTSSQHHAGRGSGCRRGLCRPAACFESGAFSSGCPRVSEEATVPASTSPSTPAWGFWSCHCSTGYPRQLVFMEAILVSFVRPERRGFQPYAASSNPASLRRNY